jgi:hypothetical protein
VAPPGIGNTGTGTVATDGKRKAQLEPVYAAAFDKKRGELLVFNPRFDQRGQRLQGNLIRYNIENNYAPVARYKLPHLAARAVVDSKQGLLYLVAARADSPQARTQLAQQIADHASATGDIAIYDLKPLYEGKTEDSADLKPLATLPFYAANRYIRGLLLNEDGSRLYVLTTQLSGGRPTKSTLSLIDTASRKTIKSRDLPEPAGEMIWSADGKHLILSELATGGGAVRVLNAEDLHNVRSYPVPGTPLDLATTPKGQILVSVVSSAATPNRGPQGGGSGRPGGIGAPPGAGGGIGAPTGTGPFGDDAGGGIGAPPGAGGGIGAPPGAGGGIGAPPGAGGGTNPQLQAKILLLSDQEGVTELKLLSNNANKGYVKVSADGRSLFVSSFRSPGFDIYEIADLDRPVELKLRAALRTAGGTPVGGHFFTTPDGKHLIFHSGAVIDADDAGGQTGVPIGLPGGGGNGTFPGGLPGGGASDTPPAVPPQAPGVGLPGGGLPIGPGANPPPPPPPPPNGAFQSPNTSNFIPMRFRGNVGDIG